MGDVSGEFSGDEEKGRENGVRQVLEETDGGSAHQVLVWGGGKIPPQGVSSFLYKLFVAMFSLLSILT